MLFHTPDFQVENENFSTTYFNRRPAKVVVSVPHDGFIRNDFDGLFTERRIGWKGRDLYVWPVVNRMLVHAITHEASIDAVRFLMARAYVDANREVQNAENLDPDTQGQIAFDDPRLARVYGFYHEQIEYLLRRSCSEHGEQNVFFVDMHGFGKQPAFAPEGGYDLILGTAYRSTIRYGEPDVAFARFMSEKGYRVFLPAETPVTGRADPYSAGHITRLYARKFAINAIQIEIAPSFRGRGNTEKGNRLSDDMAEFFSRT